jgi:hypothetical protein
LLHAFSCGVISADNVAVTYTITSGCASGYISAKNIVSTFSSTSD